MALPAILVNSATGSDSEASGAGPATALTGTGAGTGCSTSGDGLTVTFNAETDLSGVLNTGAHVIYIADSTPGARNFSKITGVNDGANTVTVADAFGFSLTDQTWAIGGKRATIAGTESKKLLENNSAAGDAMGGWTIRMESAHTETITATITFRRAFDTTYGGLIIEGESGAATRPVLTFSNNGAAFYGPISTHAGVLFQRFDIKHSGTASAAVAFKVGRYVWNWIVRDVVIGGSSTSDGFLYAFQDAYNNLSATQGVSFYIDGCEIKYSGSFGLNICAAQITNCFIHDNAGGIVIGDDYVGSPVVVLIENNVISDNTDHGIKLDTDCLAPAMLFIRHNTIHNNSNGAGIYVEDDTVLPRMCTIENNSITANGTYGIDLPSAEATLWEALGLTIRHNNFGTGATANTSGTIHNEPTIVGISGNLLLDPGYANAGSDDYSVGSNMQSAGYPNAVYNGSATRNWVDIGAAQRKPAVVPAVGDVKFGTTYYDNGGGELTGTLAVGGGGLIRHPGMAGGMNA